VQLLSQTLGETIAVELKIEDGLGTAVADPAQVESAVMNLAINARDAMPTGGRLVIEAANARLDDDYVAQNPGAMPGEYVMLAIGDTGTGMPAEIMARALDPFFTTKAPGQGTGLGLSMVYGFVRQSGGHMKIQSEVGQGTTIRLYLPRTDEPAIKAESANGNGHLEVSGEGRIILVAEDDPGVRAVAVLQLQELGYRVVEAEDGPSALKALAGNEPIDLLLTDMVMPGGMTGLELARAATERRPGLRVLYTSGYSTSFAAPGAVPGVLLQKPFRDEDLARELSRAFRQQDS
jgi:CheY-like chemotaxis protein